jgi:hypothetical protein
MCLSLFKMREKQMLFLATHVTIDREMWEIVVLRNQIENGRRRFIQRFANLTYRAKSSYLIQKVNYLRIFKDQIIWFM